MRKKTWLITLLLFWGIFLCGFTAQANGTSRALLITRGDYGDRNNDLSPGPENDGENFLRILGQANDNKMEYSWLTKEGAESVNDVKKAVRDMFANSKSDDINYFFYSGHGGEEGMWLGGNEFLSARDLAVAFSGVSGTNFLVIDCCYSGNLIIKSSRESFSGRFISEFENSLRSLKARSAITNDNFHVMAASSVDELSVQGGLGAYGEQMGYFTSSLSAGCGVDFTKVSSENGYECAAMADADRDGTVTFDELYKYTAATMWTSDASVYPEDDTTPFIEISEDRIPSTVVTDADIYWDEDGTAYLNVVHAGKESGIFQGCFYKYSLEDEAYPALLMSVSPEPDSYKYSTLQQAGNWEYRQENGCSQAGLPLEYKNMPSGEYLLFVNEKGGNTGCFIFKVTLDGNARAEDSFLSNADIYAKESFNVDEEGVLDILIDLGSTRYANYCEYPVSCRIYNSSGMLISNLESQRLTQEMSQGVFSRHCSFVWDGCNSRGNQVSSGIYTLEILIRTGSAVRSVRKAISVKSTAQPTEDIGIAIENMSISLNGGPYIYDGTYKRPKVTIPGLKEGTHFTVSYFTNLNAGRAEVCVKGKDGYSGTAVRYFTILPANTSAMNIIVQNHVSYTGKKLTPKVAVSYKKYSLIEGKDYRVSYSNNKKVGYGKVTISGIGNYAGESAKNFRILPQKSKILRAKKSTAGLWKIRWKKVTSADGYELRYTTDKTFTRNVKRKKLGEKKRETTLRLPVNKKYYFKIRSYKKVKGKTWYSLL